MQDLISVIVLTYNQEKTIRRTLDSILAQKCHIPFEIVIGEDASTDRTRDICEEYLKKYPQIVRLMDKAPNKGLIDNYFDCFLSCKGKYIADCAGDDFWICDDKLERQVNILEKDETITLVHTCWDFYDEKKGERIPSRKQIFSDPITDGNKMLEDIICRSTEIVIHLCSAMYRADVLKKEYFKNTFLFRNKDLACEDMQICFVLATMGKIAYIPDVTLCYSCGLKSASNLCNETEQFKFVEHVTNLSYYLCKEYGLKGKRIDNYFKKRIFTLYMHAFRSYDKELIKKTSQLKQQYNVGKNFKISIVELVTSNIVFWQLGLMARKVYKKLFSH